jgi:putative transposase
MQTVTTERHHIFGEYDRITIEGTRYRPVTKVGHVHQLQHVSNKIFTDRFVEFSDNEINTFIARKAFVFEEGYFSKALSQLRMRGDDTDVRGLSEEELRTIAWKVEWCVRFNARRTSAIAEARPKVTMHDLGEFIEQEKDLMDRWYLRSYGERRKAGRMVTLKNGDKERKPFDYPSPSALWNWLKAFEDADYRLEAFKPGYNRCGNRQQLDADILKILNTATLEYLDRRRPAKVDIYEFVDVKIGEFNATRPGKSELTVSERSVRRRINLLGAFERDAARHGEDYAVRKYLPVGEGLDVQAPMQRIEMDDWNVDLHTLITNSPEWKAVPKKKRVKPPSCRCTITIGIDVATKTIVGFNLTMDAPSARGSMAAVRSTMVDKNSWAQQANTKSDWPMYGRPEKIATDGGPAFKNNDVRTAVRKALTARALPDQDPRMRGTIESFFRGFRRICRFFAGRAFANVVELGDYKADEMASLTVEQFRQACIVYIVDRYHHKAHRGLEYGTPYAAWRKLTANGIPMPPSRGNLRLAFGQEEHSTLDKNGVLFLNNSYQSDALNELLKLTGVTSVRLIADADDVDSVFVYVDRSDHRQKLSALGVELFNGFVEADCMGVASAVSGQSATTKEKVLDTNAIVRQQARREQKEGAEFVRSANKRLYELGDASMEDAGHTAAHKFTKEKASKTERAMDAKRQAALGEVEHAETPIGISRDTLGQTIATANSRGGRRQPTTKIPAPVAAKPALPINAEPNRRPPSRSNFFKDND